MKKYLSITAVLFLVLSCVAAIAQVTLPESPEASLDWLKLVGELIANPKAFLSTSGAAVVVFLTIQLFKKFGGHFKGIAGPVQFAIITVLGVVYTFLFQKVTGGAAVSIATIIMGIFASGGAASIFGAIKLLLPEKWLKYLGEEKKA